MIMLVILEGILVLLFFITGSLWIGYVVFVLLGIVLPLSAQDMSETEFINYKNAIKIEEVEIKVLQSELRFSILPVWSFLSVVLACITLLFYSTIFNISINTPNLDLFLICSGAYIFCFILISGIITFRYYIKIRKFLKTCERKMNSPSKS